MLEYLFSAGFCLKFVILRYVVYNNAETKEARYTKSGSKSKSARTGQLQSQPSQASQASQASRLNESWSSMDSSQTSNILISCKVCTHEINIKSLDDHDLDYIKCSVCDQYYHGECLSIDGSIIPHLHIFREVGGWCCTYCCRNAKSFIMKSIVNVSDNESSNVNSCNKLISEINDIKTQIQSITEFLSSSLPSLPPSSKSIIQSSSNNNRSNQSTVRHRSYSGAVGSVAAARDSDRQPVPANSRGRIVDGGANLPHRG